MYLKSIELYGFKSFADRTKIDFNENITCIVGPNGTGKSNITDAIRWVLGEQSYITLRGSKMQDIIFAGTNNRRALGLAEVIITFDNTENFLDTDYSEVQVKRKLYKNGDSEYSINNQQCRLKDIRELFMDTGIGKDGYSIIGQGKIDEILNSKPIERRSIFEEASGISKYKHRKIEVERKLKQTKENLVRLSDLLVEIKSQRDQLEGEAKIAEKYLKIFNEIKSADLKTSYYDIYQIFKSKYDIDEKKLETTNLIEDKNKEIEELTSKFKNIKIKLEETESEINELQAINVENVKKERDYSNSIELIKEKLNTKNSDLESNKSKSEFLKNSIANLDKELAENNKNKNNSTELKYTFESEFDDINNRINEIKENKIKLENDKSEFLKEIKGLEKEHNANEVKLNTLLNLNAQRDEYRNKITHQFSMLEESNKELLNKLQEIIDSINSKENIINEIKQKIDRAELNLKNNLDEKTNLENSKTQLNNEISNRITRLNTLENMEESYEGYNRSVREFFRITKKRNIEFKELHDTVGNIIEVPPEFEKAITTALGGATQNLVVETFKSAQSIISFLKNERLGRITFLPLDNLRIYKRQTDIDSVGFIDYASNLVEYDPKHKKVIDYLLGNIIVADNLDNAKVISNKNKNKRIVTLDGDVINPGGSVSGGSMKTKGSLFGRKNEISVLKTDINELNNRLEKIDKNIEKLNSQIITDKEELKKLNNRLNVSKIEKDKLNQDRIEFELNNKNNLENIQDFENQLKDYNNQIVNSQSEIENLNSDINDLEKKLENLNVKVNSLEDRISNLDNNLSDKSDKLNELNIKIANSDSEINFLEKTIERLENEKISNKRDRENTEELISNLKIDIDELTVKREETIFKLEEIKQTNSTFDERYKKLNDKRKEILSSYDSYSDKISQTKTDLIELEKETYILDNKIENNIIKRDNIINYIQERYNYTLEIFDNNVEVEKPKMLKKDLNAKKRELDRLGNVNLSSIKAFKDAKERYDFTSAQCDDLDKTEQKLTKLLAEIEVTMKEKFSESFKEINDNFNRIFNYLFDGGKAQLVLEDTEDFSEAGVDIIAQLPGKKQQLLEAMSGGERSMTTVALLFALLETKPAPFCLLDEVDAALDEANIRRFLNYLKNLDNIQFALVTHRKTTMAAADYIYGITMEEPGISKVISLKFDGRTKENV